MSDRKACVILVEDDAGVRRSMQLLLRGRGFDVRAYASARALLVGEANTENACLVADYRLGDCNGVDLIKSLRAKGWRGPALLVTGFATPELRRSAHEAGFGAMLEKPFNEQALVNTVTRLTANELP